MCNTLLAYFEGKKELFEGHKISKCEKDWVKYPILYVDFVSWGLFHRVVDVDYQNKGCLKGFWIRKLAFSSTNPTFRIKLTKKLMTANHLTKKQARFFLSIWNITWKWFMEKQVSRLWYSLKNTTILWLTVRIWKPTRGFIMDFSRYWNLPASTSALFFHRSYQVSQNNCFQLQQSAKIYIVKRWLFGCLRNYT